jgi:hypothetical protein
MTKKRERTGGDAPSGQKKPEAPGRILFNAAHCDNPMESGRNTLKGKIRHGIARATENLRGMRLSLVPGSNSGECLLQGLRDKAERLSFA